MDNLLIKKATIKDTTILHKLILGLATYEKRPEDMTASIEDLKYWLFERNIASSFILYKDSSPIGYAIYYPIFGSFSAKGKVYLEDIFINPEHRGKGYGKYFLSFLMKDALSNGYKSMELSCLDWNTPSMNFYKKYGASEETGRKHFDFSLSEMQKIANLF